MRAEPTQTASRPGRTLAILLAVIVALGVWTLVPSQRTPKLGLDLRGGTQVILTPVSVSRRMADHIKGAEFCVVPECGHITFTEKPQETAALIEAFLQRVVKH